ncbi:MAG: hypothetical protein ABI840_04055 [bacterium]
MQIIALLWGIFSVIGMIIGFIPCLGAYNWINIPFAAVGIIISIIGIVNAQPGESRSAGTTGLIMCGAAVAFGAIRLSLGGGIF